MPATSRSRSRLPGDPAAEEHRLLFAEEVTRLPDLAPNRPYLPGVAVATVSERVGESPSGERIFTVEDTAILTPDLRENLES